MDAEVWKSQDTSIWWLRQPTASLAREKVFPSLLWREKLSPPWVNCRDQETLVRQSKVLRRLEGGYGMLERRIWVVWGLWGIELVVRFLYARHKIVKGAFDRVQSPILLIPTVQFHLMWKMHQFSRSSGGCKTLQATYFAAFHEFQKGGRFCVHCFPLREIWWNCFHVCSDLCVPSSSTGSLATRLAPCPGGISVGGCKYMMNRTGRNCGWFTNKLRGGERQFTVCAWTGSLSKLRMNMKYVLQNCQ